MSLDFVRYYVITMRPYLLFVSGITGIVGLSFAPSISIPNLMILFLVFFLSYGFGQALTDCFQIDTDSLSSPYRPLVQGSIKRWQSLGVSLTLLTVSCAILFFLNTWILPLGLLCVGGLITYTPFKRKWWGGPFYNAWIVALLPVIGKLAASGRGSSPKDVMETGILGLIVISTFFRVRSNTPP